MKKLYGSSLHYFAIYALTMSAHKAPEACAWVKSSNLNTSLQWRGMDVWYANINGINGTCGGDKKLALHEGITRFHLKRSSQCHSDGNTKKWPSQVFHGQPSLPHPGWKRCFYSPDLSPVSAQSWVIKLCNLINGTLWDIHQFYRRRAESIKGCGVGNSQLKASAGAKPVASLFRFPT